MPFSVFTRGNRLKKKLILQNSFLVLKTMQKRMKRNFMVIKFEFRYLVNQCGLWINKINITWGFVRNENY